MISSALCIMCMRERDGLPAIALDVYRPPTNLVVEVAHLMGDQQIIDADRNRPKAVFAEVPAGIVSRVLRALNPLRKAPDPVSPEPGESSVQIAKSRKREPLF